MSTNKKVLYRIAYHGDTVLILLQLTIFASSLLTNQYLPNALSLNYINSKHIIF